MAVKTLFLGPSYPSVSAMPAPSKWTKNLVKRGPANESADGTLYAHQMAVKWEWRGAWEEIDATDLATIYTEFSRSRSLALVDFDSTSWTVVASFQGMEVVQLEGTNPPLYNVQIAFREK